MAANTITGSMVALVTPLHDDGAVDYVGLKRLIEWHVDAGTHAIVAVGTTGESATLDYEEHIAVIRATVDLAAGRVPVIAGTGANSTREALALARGARSAGADAHLSVTPYYNKPTQEGLKQHFRAIADAVDLPMILYNVPGRTAVDMAPDTTLSLAEHPHIVGIKEATGSIERMRDIIQRGPDDFAVYSGEDNLGAACMLSGGKGSISVTANVAPRLMAQMAEAALAGDQATTESLDARLAPLHRELFCQTNPIPVKWALHRMGLIGPTLRLPLTPLDDVYQAGVEEALNEAGCLDPD
ncbi:4-hydroxy-tetrahydrodipicolinate synthase [Guyparkeria hydrothermalis]|uniref:4-hydroxy-tetrahydrodipicolinate synthase n=1 Tax=Guyparkeria halophila TaxID=47960 RepID=A0A6I6CTS5_9GAMM|nr:MULTISPECIES: 4-hydroxy-tetrahydrodipicolinate synthase [Guyparkeria]MCL7752031.1 4-hydroxy-tetrahydrodipicolinate synthase [Guyparkeria hydrothermalis]QGT77866.1 4-hydroxy-tetrahydrodipicolinate synthase [Guyparkeria halophila]TKA89292.1 4-hydroxy-tetrahydrodipicolinate synthase [Guyparkeria sp. SB14A]